jgi:hypothetical protein
MIRGDVVPILGRSASLDAGGPATYSELAAYLAEQFDYPVSADTDLPRMAQLIETVVGKPALSNRLRKIFDDQHLRPTRFHAMLADAVASCPRQPSVSVIVTTSFDDRLEQACRQRDEPYDLLVYQAQGSDRGSLLHVPAFGEPQVVTSPARHRFVATGSTVIWKACGSVVQGDWARSSLVITEDDYLDYATRAARPEQAIPATVLERLVSSHFLFLGFDIEDWTQRLILNPLWSMRELSYRSWAVSSHPSREAAGMWERRAVELIDLPLDEYVHRLSCRLADRDPTSLADGPNQAQ